MTKKQESLVKLRVSRWRSSFNKNNKSVRLLEWHCLMVCVNYVLLSFYFREDYYYYFATE